jgi:hypothetical protein
MNKTNQFNRVLSFKRLWQKKPNRTRGQAMVEFTMAIPVFLLLSFGILEFGYLFFVYSSVFSATREAARYGASVGLVTSSVPRERDCAGIRASAVRVGTIAGITPADVDIRYDHGPSDTRAWGDLPTCESNPTTVLGDRIIVRVNIRFNPIIGIIPSFDIQNVNSRTLIKHVDVTGAFPTATASPVPSP